MDKELIKRIIVSNQHHVEKVDLLNRKFKFEENGNYVFIGVRRAGKSYLMFQRMQELIKSGTNPEQIIYINFEDDRLSNPTTEDLDLITSAYSELFPHKPIFFLDEIQIVPNWEKFVRRLADSSYRVYVTGSNAKMLSNEIMTTLGGRFLVQEVYPFSLRELLAYNGLCLNEENWKYNNSSFSSAMRLYNNYFFYGGFPELSKYENKREWLSSLYQKIFLGDFIARYGIRNPLTMRLLVKKLAETVKHPVSYNRLKNILASANAPLSISTLPTYIENLTETLLIFSLKNYASSFSDRETIKKYYFVDNGILNLFLFDPETALLENLVAITLYKRYKDRLFYYNKNIEADFYVPDEGILIQACYSISDESTYKRELKSLVAVAKHLKAKRQIIITWDQEGSVKESGYQIDIIPLWKWLLNEDACLSSETYQNCFLEDSSDAKYCKEGLEPWVGENPQVLILGTFPGETSLQHQEYYHDGRNPFWSLLFEIFGDSPSENNRKEYIISKKIALWTSIKSCIRKGNSRSNNIEHNTEKFNDINSFLKQHPTIHTIVLNGKGKSKEYFDQIYTPEPNIKVISLPSTAAFTSYEKKRTCWTILKGLIKL